MCVLDNFSSEANKRTEPLGKTFSFNLNFDLGWVRGSALNRYHMKLLDTYFRASLQCITLMAKTAKGDRCHIHKLRGMGRHVM